MPVSRKRKKKPGKSRRPAVVGQPAFTSESDHSYRVELAEASRNFFAFRQEIDELRAFAAATAAGALIDDLVRASADQPDVIVEDVLCERLGRLLSEAEHEPVDDRPGPRHVAEALVVAAEAAVDATAQGSDARRAPWHVLTAVAGILPGPEGVAAAAAVRARSSGEPGGPAVTGPVLWTRDRYGSRFAVVAPIGTAAQPIRWYLWDVDACGHGAFTVHSGFYPASDAALTSWQAGVGHVASAGSVLTPVDDPWLLSELLPAEDGLFRIGGESVEQFAEYHRSRRLAEAVREAVPRRSSPPDRELDVADAAQEFAAWLRTSSDQRNLPADLDELTVELADSWNVGEVSALFTSCSPHRVALCVLHLRNFYTEDFADQLVALLPDWTRWLAERNGTPQELAERCLPYATGTPNPELEGDDIGPADLARVIE